MKLIIQIPCYNEAESLPETIQALPKTLPGVDDIELLVIDDGSVDDTARIARQCGVDHILRLKRHAGLAYSFAAGLERSLQLGADIIVNTDADNQYMADDIRHLIAPVVTGKADIVIGDRGVTQHRNFSFMKRQLQRLGSWVVSQISGIPVPDATSGFRAFSRTAAIRMMVLSDFSYTLETLIQAGASNLKVEFIPVRTNPPVRPSRLMRNTPHYLANSIVTIIRVYGMYQPLRLFSFIGGLLILSSMILGLRFIYYYLVGQGTGHIQSLILAAILMIIGFQSLLMGMLADLIGFNRKILEDTYYRIRRLELGERVAANESTSDSAPDED